MTAPHDNLENRTFDELAVGDSASLTREITEDDILRFAAVSGDTNPAHLDHAYAAGTPFHDIIAHGMWGGALISAVLGTALPGPGTIYLRQTLSFRRPVRPGDAVRATVTVAQKGERGHVTLDCACVNAAGETVIRGEAEVIAPADKVRRARPAEPRLVLIESGRRLETFVSRARDAGPATAAVVCPVEPARLAALVAAAEAGLVAPTLVGPRAAILRAATDAGVEIDADAIVDAGDAEAAARAAVGLAADGAVDILVQGCGDLAPLLAAATVELATETAPSHAWALDVPVYKKPVIFTDAVMHAAPDLETKAHIVRNAVALARALGVETPKVAVLAAANSASPSAADAAALARMGAAGAFDGALVDGPLGIEEAMTHVADDRGRASPVAGDADVAVAPNGETGALLVAQLDHLAGAVAAGVVLGVRAPIAVPSDDPRSLAAACALAALVSRARA